MLTKIRDAEDCDHALRRRIAELEAAGLHYLLVKDRARTSLRWCRWTG
jgi:hypothetical protein